MPYDAPRHCSADPRCPNLTTGGPCAKHARARDLARGSAIERGYDRRWADYSRRWLALHRWCGERADFRQHPEHSTCTRDGNQTRADVTDHIRPMRAGGARYDPANHQSLCTTCHGRKTNAHDGGGIHARL